MSSAGQNDAQAGATAMPTSGKESPRNLSDFGAALNLMKFLVGLGIISLPNATKHVGWLPSMMGLAIVAFITVWGVFFAVQARFKLERLEEEARELNTARTMTEGDPLLNQSGSWQDLPDSGCGFFDRVVGKVFGPAAQCLFAGCIVLGQFTTLVMYLNVITSNFESYLPPTHRLAVLIGVVVVLGIFSLVPTLQGVAVLSTAGLAIYTYLYVGLVNELFVKAHAGTLPDSAVMVQKSDTFLLGQWFGISCFAFSGFPICMVIYEELRSPRNFHTVVATVFAITWAAYSSFALLGYLCFGEDTNTLVFLNFAEGSAFRSGSAAALGCILCFSFVIQAVPVFSCTAKAWDLSGFGGKMAMGGLPMPAIRWGVLGLVVIVAYLIPNIKVLMNTIGAISGVVGGFIFPAVTYLKLSSRDEWVSRSRCFIVLIIGVMGAYYSITGQ